MFSRTCGLHRPRIAIAPAAAAVLLAVAAMLAVSPAAARALPAPSPQTLIGNVAVPNMRIDFVSALQGFGLNPIPAENEGGFAAGPSLLLATADGGQSWHSRPFPKTAGVVSAISFTNGSDGWAVSYPSSATAASPEILVTTDGGSDWANETVPASVSVLTDIDFVDSLHGWAVGWTQGVAGLSPLAIGTVNGGQTWTVETLPALGNGQALAVSFSSDVTGWAIGSGTGGAFIVGTSNGGATWVAQPVPNGVSQLLAVRAVGADAWAVGTAGSAGVVITSQGGGAWQTQTTPATLGLDGVAFADQSNGWATGLDTAGGPIVLQTTDGGAVWTQTAATPAVTTPSAVATVAGAGAWVIGGGSCSANAVVAQSSDGGGSWQTELAMVDTQAQYRRPAFHSGFGAMIVKTCEYRVVLSADIARFWTPAAVFPTAFQSLALAMPDRNHLWVVGSNQSGPVIYASKDGGTSWRLQQTPAGFVQPDHVAFGTNNNGWSLGQDQGSNSAVIGTSDGGRHWTTDPIPAGVSLTAIAAIGSSDVWAVGSNTSGGAAVIASVDGGMTWGMQTLPAGLGALQDASFVDALHGWAAGQDTAGNGAVASTSDGGATWQQLTVPTSDPFNSVSFASDSIGWVLGPSGVLWTTDGGATWAARRHSIICPFPEQLAAISTHTLAMVGAKVGGAPVIVRSTTSAFNWDAMTVFDPTWVDESPVTGAPGSTANLSGHGFDPGELVSVRWGSVTGSPLATVTADSSGSFSISFTVPSSATAARYRVYAVGKVSLATPFHNFEVT